MKVHSARKGVKLAPNDGCGGIALAKYGDRFKVLYGVLAVIFMAGLIVASPTILYKTAAILMLVLVVFAYKKRKTKSSYAIVGSMLFIHHALLFAMQKYQSVSVDLMTPFIINAGLLYLPLLPNHYAGIAGVSTLLVHFYTYRGDDDFWLVIVKMLGTILLAFISGLGLQFLRNLSLERDRFYKFSITDPLTGLYTFTYMIQMGKKLIDSGHKLRAILIDLDDYKNINDTYGHFIGNKVLIQFANILCDVFGPEALVGRLGGDEFIVLLKKAEDEKLIGELFEKVKCSCYITDPELVPIHLEFSYGIGIQKNDERVNIEELLNRAEINMYSDKVSLKDNQINCENDYDIPHEFADLLTVLSQKDMYTFIHSAYVARFGGALAERLALSASQINRIRLAGWLHDIGKIAIPNQILRKPASLTEHEYQTIQKHVIYSLDILRSLKIDSDVLQAVGEHHERYDGKGYPQGKKKDEISIEGRVLAIADAYSAMIIKRIYRRRHLSVDEAILELQRGKESQFDPEFVDTFVALIKAREDAYLTNLSI